MNQVFILFTGEYSDRYAVGAYTTRELAEEAQKVVPDSDIEEMELDVKYDVPPGCRAWCVHLHDGVVECGFQVMPVDFNSEFEVFHEPSKKFINTEIYITYCWARDREHAEKIAIDRYYKYKAIQAGIA
jgi:hypothetical protein